EAAGYSQLSLAAGTPSLAGSFAPTSNYTRRWRELLFPFVTAGPIVITSGHVVGETVEARSGDHARGGDSAQFGRGRSTRATAGLFSAVPDDARSDLLQLSGQHAEFSGRGSFPA